MATEQERQLFKKVLASIGQEYVGPSASKVTGFMAMVGCRYDHKLMVVGRAPNGWICGILPENLASEADNYSRKVLESVNKKPCPMSWVTERWGISTNGEYNTKRSAFWRTIRKVVAQLDIADVERDSWPSHLVWSNLYKISPEEGGNPDKILREIQQDGCKELLNLELRTYTPSRLLLLTGTEWAQPFLPDLGGTSPNVAEPSYVKSVGTLRVAPGKQPIRYVVADHPQGKPERQWIEDVCSVWNH